MIRRGDYLFQRLVPFASLDYKDYDPVQCFKWDATINVIGEFNVKVQSGGKLRHHYTSTDVLWAILPIPS